MKLLSLCAPYSTYPHMSLFCLVLYLTYTVYKIPCLLHGLDPPRKPCSYAWPRPILTSSAHSTNHGCFLESLWFF